MATEGGQIGNDNAARGKEWRQAIQRALAKRSNSAAGWRSALDRLAGKLIDEAEAGQAWAIQEIGNRLDGKPAQAVHVSSEDGTTDLVEVLRSLAERLPV
jgi:hypothetical protein